ncbi:DUF559 domain-containing protein [Candidatus Saccharibacteria bacterium]|nr:DUF559 domain-containing protein [Candidatus Saccharibacteria bacterium]
MTLQDYYRRNPKLHAREAYLERMFLENVFYPSYGDEGLEHLTYQERIYDSVKHRCYFIDFVIREGNKKYAIELDGYNYHGRLSAAEFDRQEERTNEIIRQGYELIRFSYNKVKNHPVSVRCELSRRINFPISKTALNTPIEWDDSASKKFLHQAKLRKKVLEVILSCVSPILLFLVLNLGFKILSSSRPIVNTASHSTQNEYINTQKTYIDGIVDNYNQVASNPITSLTETNIFDSSSPDYRKTNTYAGQSAIAKHGNLANGEIWIISCNGTDGNSHRIYAESSSYDELRTLAQEMTPTLNPGASESHVYSLSNFNKTTATSGTSFNYPVYSTWVMLYSKNDGGYKLNLNTNCMNIYF